ncbi:zf-HC2 domain-containing protein [bacterium]|nr:zf-HC2 domain-containing protein [candidate division CSSED10-310 bacterium]
MKCEQYQKLIMGYIDGELTESEIRELMDHLKVCEECRREMRQFKILNAVTDISSFQTPEDKFWEGYWSGIYNKMERRLGWILVTGGLILLMSGALFWLCSQVLLNPSEPIWVRVGIPLTMIGTAVLLISVCRERVRAYRFERYKDVRR